MTQALGDLVESCIGAILLDTGFDLNRVWRIMLSFLDPVMSISKFQLSPIRELQEISQSHNLELNFVSSNKGRTFSVEAKVDGKEFSGTSCATNISRKAAKTTAAKQLISILKVNFTRLSSILCCPSTSMFVCVCVSIFRGVLVVGLYNVWS